MILQTIIASNPACLDKEFYYQCESELVETTDSLILHPNHTVSFFSYMNMFDIDMWKKYTHLSSIHVGIEISGCGSIALKGIANGQIYLLQKQPFLTTDNIPWKTICFNVDFEKHCGICYLEICSVSEVHFRNARFETSEPSPLEKDVHIAINICTYHRNEEVQKNLRQLRGSRFFQSNDELFEKLHIVTVDNGSELDVIDENYIRLVHNPNTGGSGGFQRGLEEIRKWDNRITHVVFMDDDVEFHMESLYRLYALLSYLKVEYRHESVAGRMFRTDNPKIQYTAAEIWNKGDLRHIGLNADMTQEQEIIKANQNEHAEYGGWWFCCYPMKFARENNPLPFFLHCDDVEYGLRHGGTPIILNGIQVWHETYEYRQNSVIAYYDTRNSLIVNAIHENLPQQVVIARWKQVITNFHLQKDYINEYVVIKAMYDFLKGKKYFIKNGNKQIKLLKISCGVKFLNKIMWRYCYWALIHKYLLIVKKYREE